MSIAAVQHAGQSSSCALLAELVCCISAAARLYTIYLSAPEPPPVTYHLYCAIASCRHMSGMEHCCQALGSSSSASAASSCGCQHTMPINNQDNHVAAGMKCIQHMQCCHYTTSAVATACSNQVEQQQATHLQELRKQCMHQPLPQAWWGIQPTTVNDCLVGCWEAINISLDRSSWVGKEQFHQLEIGRAHV